MNYSVKVRRVIENGKPLKATCSVTMDDQFTVHGVKVIQNEKGRFIAMPSEAYKDNDGNERFRDVCHPITSDARKAMEAAVFSAYEKAVAEAAKNTDTTAHA
ncbi:MAG: SpoVG family protein [Clostridia bacterium]|nr:SpoVG family protein [Clostridia bacterium]